MNFSLFPSGSSWAKIPAARVIFFSGDTVAVTKMKDFIEMEKLALEIYSRANYEPKEDLLYNIKDRGIYYWNENINLINEVDKLNLHDEIHQRNSKIKLYCELRIKSFQLIYKAIRCFFALTLVLVTFFETKP